jgi:hypothetical protein
MLYFSDIIRDISKGSDCGSCYVQKKSIPAVQVRNLVEFITGSVGDAVICKVHFVVFNHGA